MVRPHKLSSLLFTAVLLTGTPKATVGQNLEQCPAIPQLQNSQGVTVGAKYNHTYTYGIENAGTQPYDVNAYQLNIVKAFTDWTNANNAYEYGSKTSFSHSGPGSNVRVQLVDTEPSGPGFACPAPNNPFRRCDGLTIHNTGGLQTGATILMIKGMPTPDRILSVAIHEILHFQGGGDSTDHRTAANGNAGVTEITACDALAVGRFSASQRRDMLPDPCRGAPCRAPIHPLLPVCYFGALPNGWCYPDPRYKTPPNNRFNVLPVGGITSPTTVGTSGALTIAARDQNGFVRLVDWYVNNQYFYTAKEDPFDFPYANVQPGTYLVQARMLDDLGEFGSTATVQVTVQSGGGGGGGGSAGTLGPWQRLYANQRLYSGNGAFYLIHQSSDGHLVQYANNGPPLWATGFTIPGGGGYTEMDGSTGNLVSYYPSGWPPYWAANPPASSNSFLRVNDDQSIKIYSSGGTPLCTVTNIPWGWNGSCP